MIRCMGITLGPANDNHIRFKYEADADELLRRLPRELLSSWLLSFLKEFPLSGVNFSLSERHDESALGAELMWFTAPQFDDQALLIYPGIPIAKLGYLPIGRMPRRFRRPLLSQDEGRQH